MAVQRFSVESKCLPTFGCTIIQNQIFKITRRMYNSSALKKESFIELKELFT